MCDAVPANLKGVYMLNPVTGPLEAFRWSLLNTARPPLGNLGYAAALSVAVFGRGR